MRENLNFLYLTWIVNLVMRMKLRTLIMLMQINIGAEILTMKIGEVYPSIAEEVLVSLHELSTCNISGNYLRCT